MLCCRVSTSHCFFHSLCLLQNSPLPCTRASAQLTAVSTSRLLLMPCRIVLFASTPCLLSGLALCDECFTHCFFSDVGQHLFGALPEEARPVYVCSDADKSDSLCRRDFCLCRACSADLSQAFWAEFPDHLVNAQRYRPSSSQVTLEQAHRRIVASALRILREDPLSPIARCEGS
jgi:hypothetical protein